MLKEVISSCYRVYPDNSLIEKKISRNGSRFIWTVRYLDCLGIHVKSGIEASKFSAELAAKKSASALIPCEWR